jgi:hypothetical protein
VLDGRSKAYLSHGTASHINAEIPSMTETEFAPFFKPFETLVISTFTWTMH